VRRAWQLTAAGAVLLAAAAAAQQSAPVGEWRRIGGDAASTRYSPLDQINAQNVGSLRIAWTWRGDNFGSAPEVKNETTPIMVGGVLYFTAGDRRAVIAADAGTGFGAGASGTVFGARGARTALSRATAIFAAVFMLNSLALAYMGTREAKVAPKTILDEAAETQTPAPSTSVPPPASVAEVPTNWMRVDPVVSRTRRTSSATSAPWRPR